MDHLNRQLQHFQEACNTQQNANITRTMIINITGNHWVMLVVSRRLLSGQTNYQAYYVDSLGNKWPTYTDAINRINVSRDFFSLRVDDINANTINTKNWESFS